ncbi:MAG: glycoside hydrolase family 88 protein [Oscillospiraceae bacterium]|jgi:rhamnogalacturonyl hydrolase YesR|nr:glycoside hydrolase family 88 protein [Oscillospiraceae bacterium]
MGVQPASPAKRAKQALLAMQRYPWEQGVAMQAFLERREYGLVIAMAREAAYRALPDGRVAAIGGDDAATDPCAAGEALWVAARRTGEPGLWRAYENLLAWALSGMPRNAQGVCYHMVSSKQFWVDSMYMLPPFLAVTGHAQQAMVQFTGYYDCLWDEGSGLMRHMWDDERRAFIRAAHWGTGNGWALAAMARLIDALPDAADDLARKARGLIDSLMPFLRSDGLFHDVVDEPDTFVETNLSQMLAYTLYRGMAAGWLPPRWGRVADQLYRAARKKMDAFGFIRDVCGAPHFDRPGQSPEGQAFFLLMHQARKRAARKGI